MCPRLDDETSNPPLLQARRRLARALERKRAIRTIGFDDGPFTRSAKTAAVSGIVCAGTRFEGMVRGRVRRDGFNATRVLTKLLVGGKFHDQIHLVLIDGIAFAGFNIVDLPALALAVSRPCVAVMRKHPNLSAVDHALGKLTQPQRRRRILARAGEIHESGPFVFQCAGCEPALVGAALAQATDRGYVPESLRIAHLINSAVSTGVSSNRA